MFFTVLTSPLLSSLLPNSMHVTTRLSLTAQTSGSFTSPLEGQLHICISHKQASITLTPPHSPRRSLSLLLLPCGVWTLTTCTDNLVIWHLTSARSWCIGVWLRV